MTISKTPFSSLQGTVLRGQLPFPMLRKCCKLTGKHGPSNALHSQQTESTKQGCLGSHELQKADAAFVALPCP